MCLFCFQVVSVDDIPPPIIQIGPTNQTLPKGSVAMLSCRAAGTPTPDIKWSKDGATIQSKSRFVIVQSGTLKIDGKILFMNEEGRQCDLSFSLWFPLKPRWVYLGIRTEIRIIADLIKPEWRCSNWDVFLFISLTVFVGNVIMSTRALYAV